MAVIDKLQQVNERKFALVSANNSLRKLAHAIYIEFFHIKAKIENFRKIFGKILLFLIL